MKTITSTQNQEIKSVAKLSTKKGRQETQLFIAEGVRVISALVEAGQKVVAVYAVEGMVSEAKKVLALQVRSFHSLPSGKSGKKDKNFLKSDLPEGSEAKPNELEGLSPNNIILASEPIIKKISQVKSPSGILAIFELPEKPSTEKLTSGLVLAQIADPGNMGTLIRTSAALGYNSVVIIEGCDPYSPKVIQASAGTIGQMDVFQLSWSELLKSKKDLCLTALIVQNGQKPAALDLKNTLLVVGSEAHGLPQEWIDSCDQKLSLPMPGGTESLNAAVAGSIALYLASSRSS